MDDPNHTTYRLSLFPSPDFSLKKRKRFTSYLPGGIRECKSPNPNYTQFRSLIQRGAAYYEKLEEEHLRFMFVKSESIDPFGLFRNLYNAGKIDNVTRYLVWFQKVKNETVVYPQKDDIIYICGPHLTQETFHTLRREKQCFTLQIEEWHRLNQHATGYAIVAVMNAFNYDPVTLNW